VSAFFLSGKKAGMRETNPAFMENKTFFIEKET
jgi:hypothetical protein